MSPQKPVDCNITGWGRHKREGGEKVKRIVETHAGLRLSVLVEKKRWWLGKNMLSLTGYREFLVKKRIGVRRECQIAREGSGRQI